MKQKKEKKRWGLIFFLVFIMIGTSFSFIFFGFSPQNEIAKYNGIKFIKKPSQNIWLAEIGGKEAAFSFLPNEVEDIAMQNPEKLQNRLEIDATYDLNSTRKQAIALAQHQMALTLASYNIYLRKGFTSNNTFGLPVITCKDSSLNVPVVYFRQGNSTRISSENSCIIAEGKTDADIIRVKDRIVYGVLGVVK
ncbi:hypothetical protein HY487_00080 [Candidatus Woesearchaeota archaeon]|nr:hypothetical protein [Candidatus Woesearchaeota archaeon]